ncbi:MAG TPA: methyltransferase [Eubacteriales bacterium]|nr:methyltransferase [Eubacteriales bacterium]
MKVERKAVLKYEEKLRLDQYKFALRPDGPLSKALILVFTIVLYAPLYYFVRLFLCWLWDVQPWNGLESWFSIGSLTFVRPDAAYFACGLVLVGTGVFRLVRVTAENHAVRDPQSGAPQTLLTSGMYAKSRHPMYASFILLQAGFLLSLRSLPAMILAAIAAALQYANAYFEEKKFLVPAFREEYALYRETVKAMVLTKTEAAALLALALFSAAGFFL